ncbi:MAG: amidohydrolase family protein [Streptosporangiales bacterium]|nr:amidohydrolase family protein [Streptosporangiales bacterium]
MRVDAHHHLFDMGRREYPWMDGPWADPIRRTFTATDLEAVCAPHGIAQTVVVQAVSEVEETRDLLAAPRVAGVVGWIDLTAPDVADVIAALREGPGGQALVGIRHQVHDEPDPDWLDRDDVRRGLRAVADARLVYDLLLRERELPAARRAVAALPQLSFVVDHLAKPRIADGALRPWADEIAALAGYDNVVAKLSGLVTEADWGTWTIRQLQPYVEHALECFGPVRLLFGSDWPVCLLAASYDRVVEAAEATLEGLDATERDAVFGANTRRVYRLPPAQTSWS